MKNQRNIGKSIGQTFNGGRKDCLIDGGIYKLIDELIDWWVSQFCFILLRIGLIDHNYLLFTITLQGSIGILLYQGFLKTNFVYKTCRRNPWLSMTSIFWKSSCIQCIVFRDANARIFSQLRKAGRYFTYSSQGT